MAITTDSKWRIQTVIRIPINQSFWVTHVNGAPITTTEVPMLPGDYYPNGTGDADDLYEMMTDQLQTIVPASNAFFTTSLVFGYLCVLLSSGGTSTTIDFGDPTSAGRDALGLQRDLRLPTQIVTMTDSKQGSPRTPIGTVVGDEPLTKYVGPEQFKRGVFVTDAGDVYTVFRQSRPSIQFGLHVRGRPQDQNNLVSLYHDLLDWWVSASKGKSTRVYPDTAATYPFDATDITKSSGYRLCQLVGNTFAPDVWSKMRLNHTLDFEVKPI